MGQVLEFTKPATTSPPVTSKHKRRKRHERKHGAGHIFRTANWWILRYRDWEQNGEKLERVQKCERLAQVEDGYRSKEPPAYVVDIAEKFIARIRASEHKPQSTQLLSDYIERDYLPYAQQKVRPSTFQSYEAFWRQLKPWCVALGLRLRDVEAADLQFILEQIADKKRNLSKQSLKHLKHFLGGVFKRAIVTGVMPKGFANPVREVTVPDAREKADGHAYSLEEVQTMLALIPDPARIAIAVAAFTGLRRSEIRGLRWEDYGEVVWDDGEKGLALHVVRSNWNGIEQRPKTKRSEGFVPVISPLAKLLECHRLRCGNPQSGPIFKNEAGKPADLHNYLNRQILPSIERCAQCGGKQADHPAKAGHPFNRKRAWYGWHAFRRGVATNLHRLGVPDKVIQRVLRHADVGVTQRAYIQTVDADAAKAMKLLEASLPKAFSDLCATLCSENLSAGSVTN